MLCASGLALLRAFASWLAAVGLALVGCAALSWGWLAASSAAAGFAAAPCRAFGCWRVLRVVRGLCHLPLLSSVARVSLWFAFVV